MNNSKDADKNENVDEAPETHLEEQSNHSNTQGKEAEPENFQEINVAETHEEELTDSKSSVPAEEIKEQQSSEVSDHNMSNPNINLPVVTKDEPAELNNLPAEMNNIAAELNNLPAELNNLPAELNNLPAELNNPPAELNNLPAELNNLPAELNNLPAELNNPPAELNNIPAELNNLPAELNNLPAELNNLPAELNNLPAELNNLKSPKEVIEPQIEIKASKKRPSVENVVRLFTEAAAQSMKNSYTVFRQWEESQAIKINLHRSITEKILRFIDQRVALSIEGIETVTKFFRERQRQEELYYSAMLEKIPPLGVLFSDQSGDTQKRLVPQIMKKSEQYHHQLCKNSQEIATFIQNTILRSLLEDIQKDFTKKLNGYKDQVNECRKKVTIANLKFAKKIKKYWSYYTERMVTAADKKPKPTKDLHNKELSVVGYSNKQIQAHRSFGSAVIAMITEVKKLESIRLEGVKQSFSLYMNKMSKLFGERTLADEIVKSLEHLGTKNEIETIFMISAMLSPEETAQLRKIIRLENDKAVTEEIINQFLQILEDELPDSKPLVQKEWSVMKETGLFGTLKPYKVIITVEDNILLVDTSDGKEYKKAEQTIKLEHVNISAKETAKKKKNPLLVEIQVNKPGFIMDSKNKHIFKFISHDEIDEFYYYIEKRKALPTI